MDAETIRKNVRERYGKLATMKTGETSGCGTGGDCCGSTPAAGGDIAEMIGYTGKDAASAPQGANLGLGCGNPRMIADLKPGEVVLDLGSGAGFDCFLAADEVGPTGKVIGVDMTPEMVAKARENAAKAEAQAYANVEFRLGEIEHLPVADASVDVIISNCVINLSADKENVFKEAYRVLKPGGRMAIFDIVAVAAVPDAVRNDLEAISACIGGARSVDEIKDMLGKTGFEKIRLDPLDKSRQAIDQWLPLSGAGSYVRSAGITAVKPFAHGPGKPVPGEKKKA